jgi:hypothetical protein
VTINEEFAEQDMKACFCQQAFGDGHSALSSPAREYFQVITVRKRMLVCSRHHHSPDAMFQIKTLIKS